MLASNTIMMTSAIQADTAISDQTIDDHDLLSQVATGDRQAFETLYTRYAPRVQSYLRKRLRDPEGIEEALNDIMIIIWQKPTACPPHVSLIAWLYGIARKTAYKYARPPKHHEAESKEFVSAEANPEYYLLMQDQQRSLDRAIIALPHHERQPIELLVYHGCSYNDIAIRLDAPVNTIKTRVKRACTRLHGACSSTG